MTVNIKMRRLSSLVPGRLRRWAASSLWRQMELEVVGPRGLVVRLEGRADWDVFNELFVELEYGPAIESLCSGPKERRVLVVDLGANIGLFTYQVLTRWVLAGRELQDLEVVAVEGAEANCARLDQHVVGWSDKGARVQVVRGLVGKRDGAGYLRIGSAHAMNQVGTAIDGSERVTYVDLEALIGAGRTVDLLKCDIEGSEGVFVQSYPDLLRAVRVAAVEFHHDLCDVVTCRERLASAGLMLKRSLPADEHRTTTDFFERS